MHFRHPDSVSQKNTTKISEIPSEYNSIPEETGDTSEVQENSVIFRNKI